MTTVPVTVGDLTKGWLNDLEAIRTGLFAMRSIDMTDAEAEFLKNLSSSILHTQNTLENTLRVV